VRSLTPHSCTIPSGHLYSSTCTSYRHKEPEYLSSNFVWVVRHALTFCHTNSSSLCSGSCYRHKEPEYLSWNFVWVVRHALTFCLYVGAGCGNATCHLDRGISLSRCDIATVDWGLGYFFMRGEFRLCMEPVWGVRRLNACPLFPNP